MFLKKCLLLIFFWTMKTCYCDSHDDIYELRQEIRSMSGQMKSLVNRHGIEISRLKKEVDILRQQLQQQATSNGQKNEQLTLQWAKNALQEVRIEMNELSSIVNSSEWLIQQQFIKNQIQMALAETSGLSRQFETQSSKVDELGSVITQITTEYQQMKNTLGQIKQGNAKLKKELKTAKMEWTMQFKQFKNRTEEINSFFQDTPSEHKKRHCRMYRKRISELEEKQHRIEEIQRNTKHAIIAIEKKLQENLLDKQTRNDMAIFSTKVEALMDENEKNKEVILNITSQVSDFNIMHSSILELLETVEAIEGKIDNALPEIRKEISKVEANNAHIIGEISYLKESQENDRQSVKAIAVSVSNLMEKEKLLEDAFELMNESLIDLRRASKQHFFRLNDHILKSEANPIELNSTSELPILMDAVEELSKPHAQYERLVRHLPHDCSTIDDKPGTYLISPAIDIAPIHAFCNNGSTLLQRRYNGSVDFDRRYSDYAAGFGDPNGELWIGNEALHALTSNNCSGLMVDMTDIYGGHWYAKYEKFYVADSNSGYKLELYGFTGNASDAFDYQQGMEFSAKDVDRDISNTHCAGNYEGGWWFSHCQHVNLNGKYTLGLTWFDSTNNEWIAVATSTMWLFRRPECNN